MDFLAQKDNLSEMLRFVREQGKAAGLDATALHKLELASEEALVNIISYAYPHKTGSIVVDCQKELGSKFIVTVRDTGEPFNPIDADVDVQTNKPISERKIGGLGIFLIRKVVDEVRYQRVGKENVLEMVITLRASS